MPETERLTPDPAGIARAAALLREGGIVAIPTETVYGLAADATSDAAVARIYAAKGRPDFNPLIVHVPDLEAARSLAEFTPRSEGLAARFWPGPLTMVLPLRRDAGLSARVTAGLPGVALRVPGHPVALALLAACARPLAAPSANPSGRISATTAGDVLDGLAGRIDAVIDAGACAVGVESTILDMRHDPPRLLRPGGLHAEEIAAALGLAALAEAVPDRIEAPGQLASHYAPDAQLRLNAAAPLPGEVWIGFGPGAEGAGFTLSATGDLAEAAARLFAVLRAADRAAGPTGRIAVAPVPATGLGRAINDRLQRAAAPR